MPPPVEGSATLGSAHELLRLALARELRQAAVPLAVDLRDAADRASSTPERRALSEAAGRLLQEADQLAPRAVQALVRPAPREQRDPRRLEWPRLMDDAALEQQIVAAELAQAVREIDEGVGNTWEARLRALGASDHDAAALGADGACAAVLQALGSVSADPYARRALRPLLLRRMPPVLVEAMRTADEQLAMLGVLPQVKPAGTGTSDRKASARGAQGRAPARANANAPAPPATDSRPTLATADGRSMGKRLASSASRDADGAAGAVSGPPPQAVAAAGTLVAVQRLGEAVRGSALPSPRAPLAALLPSEVDGLRFAQEAGVDPYSAAARALLFRSARERMAGAGATPQQCALVDTVAALFDYALDDRRVPASTAPLLWQLQAPVLALALLDDRYLADSPRSLSRLVEHVAALVAAFPEEAAAGGRLQVRLDAVVQGVRAAAGALQVRSSVLAAQLGRQFDDAASRVTRIAESVTEARGAVEAGAGIGRNRRDWRHRPDPTRERAVTDRLSRLIDERLEAAQVGDAVRTFVADVWLRHLRTTALRDGEESLPHRVALQVLDDLLWSADDARSTPDRQALLERIPPLIRLLSDGIRAVGGERATFGAFFDELFRIHERKLSRDPGPEGRREPPAEAGLPKPAAAAVRRRRASSVDLQALIADIDLDDYPHDAERRRLSPALVAAALQKGDWLELVDRAGIVSQAKLGWLDSRRRAVVLVRWPDGRPLSLRMSALVERFADRRAFLLAPRRPPREPLLSDE